MSHWKPKKIHWKKFFTRKLFVIVGVIMIAHYLGMWLHFYLASKGGEMLLGATIEHLCFGVPLEEEV